jgi:hypothetical protein
MATDRTADSIRQKVKTARKFETRKVICNEWRDKEDEDAGRDFIVYVKSLSGQARTDFELKGMSESNWATDNPDAARLFILERTCFIDEELTKPLFEGFEVSEITDMHPAPRERLFGCVLKISGLDGKDFEAVVKN